MMPASGGVESEDEIPDIAEKRDPRSLEGTPATGGGAGGGGGGGDFGDYIPDVFDKRNLRSVRTMSRGKSIGSDDDISDIADERNLLRSDGTIPQLSNDDDIPVIVEMRNLVY